jgi:AmmeMemoRadiSam system protein A
MSRPEVPVIFPSEKEGLQLLEVARAAIGSSLGAPGSDPEAVLERALEREVLRRPGAAFVTLHLDAELRGCVGTLEITAPLARSVARYAVAAAFQDPRFAPLSARELTAVRLSVSVLGPFTPVWTPEPIVVGRHGVSLVRGDFRSVFLPQVALEQGWDRTALLQHLAVKAGLSRDGWREAQLSVFETVSFAETLY